MFASVTANPGTICTARSANNRAAGNSASSAAVSVRHRQRRHRQHRLGIDGQRFPAGGQHPQPARGAQQQAGQLGGRVDQVLAVVQHQQQLPPGQVLRQRGGRRVPGPVLQAQRLRDGLGHQRLLPQLVQPDQLPPVAERPRQPGRGAQRQPGLAHPAGPGQCHQPRPSQQLPDLGQLTAVADEAGQLGWQIPGYAPRRHSISAPGSAATDRRGRFR
jgi:hypothetical protein